MDKVNIEDIPCFDAAMAQLISLGQEQMPDAVGMNEFFYDPFMDKDDQHNKGANTVSGNVETIEADIFGSTSVEAHHANPTPDPKDG